MAAAAESPRADNLPPAPQFKNEHKDLFWYPDPAVVAKVDWTSKDSVVTIFPSFFQEKFALDAKREKYTTSVEIDPFQLVTPDKSQVLLERTELLLEQGKKYALYGDNAVGKTSLFRDIALGHVKGFPKHIQVHHCEEIEESDKAKSVIETVVQSHPVRNAIKVAYEKINSLIAGTSQAGGDEAKVEPPTPAQLDGYLAVKDWLEMKMRVIQYDKSYENAEKMLRVLGFDDSGLQQSTNSLSGGLRMRVALCASFFLDADLLLLDDPTNHLDFPSVLWLENRLKIYRGTFVMVTHDREMLQTTCTAVILFEDKRLKYYMKTFAAFEKEKLDEDKKRNDAIDKFMLANKNIDFSSPLAREKADKLAWQRKYQDKLVLLAGKFTFPDPTALPAPAEAVAGQDPRSYSLIKLTEIRFSYNPEQENARYIFNDPITVDITASTRVGIMGPNGAGKSTLLKLLTGKHRPSNGTRTTHPTATVAYFSQHSALELDHNTTALEYMMSQFPEKDGKNKPQLRAQLNKAGVLGDKTDTYMRNLTASQRSLVVFAKLTFVCPHLLIMDEPTNFLDLQSVDSLILACSKYHGALLMVSHNRYFLAKCCTQYLSVVPGKFAIFNNMKDCEKATYTFIAELESGETIKAADLVKKNAGGASFAATNKAAAADVKSVVFGADLKAEQDALSAEQAAKAKAAAEKAAKAAERERLAAEKPKLTPAEERALLQAKNKAKLEASKAPPPQSAAGRGGARGGAVAGRGGRGGKQ
jgi:ATPase subunit of ABC transporter with duplicated ATPase domains